MESKTTFFEVSNNDSESEQLRVSSSGSHNNANKWKPLSAGEARLLSHQPSGRHNGILENPCRKLKIQTVAIRVCVTFTDEKLCLNFLETNE